jgi:hypothetical protein
VRHIVTAQSQTVALTQALPLLAKGRDNVRAAPLCSAPERSRGQHAFFALLFFNSPPEADGKGWDECGVIL